MQASAASQNVPLSFIAYDSTYATGPSSIQATTQTYYPLDGVTDPTLLYQQLVNALNASITSGGFTSVLQQASFVNGASATANAVATSLATTAPVIEEYGGSGSNNQLDDGQISGIVIGTIAGIA